MNTIQTVVERGVFKNGPMKGKRYTTSITEYQFIQPVWDLIKAYMIDKKKATIQFITEEYFKENTSLYFDEDYYCEITSYVNKVKLRKNVKVRLQPDARIIKVFATSYSNPINNRKLINYRIPYTTPVGSSPRDAGSYYKIYGEHHRICVADNPVGDCVVVFNTEESRQQKKEKKMTKPQKKKAIMENPDLTAEQKLKLVLALK